VCALALAFAPLFVSSARAQADTSSQSPTHKNAVASTTSRPKTATSKSHAKTAGAKSKTASSTTAKPHAASQATSSHSTSKTAASRRSKLTRANSKKKPGGRGQQKIDPERAEQIQEALIREHYLAGEPAGTWNQASEDALRRYQADHGWQSKTVPDSRALISLGLGPSHDHLLNPESAMTTGPEVSHRAAVNSSPQLPASHNAEPVAGDNGVPVAPADPPTTPSPSTDHDSSPEK
jgi:hypothetical protein